MAERAVWVPSIITMSVAAKPVEPLGLLIATNPQLLTETLLLTVARYCASRLVLFGLTGVPLISTLMGGIGWVAAFVDDAVDVFEASGGGLGLGYGDGEQSDGVRAKCGQDGSHGYMRIHRFFKIVVLC